MKKKHFSTIYLVCVFLLLYLPIFYLIFFSFNQGGDMNHFTGFTWKYYTELFADKRMIVIVLNTLLLALLSSLIATIVGTLGAIGISARKQKRLQSTLLTLNNVLMVSPDVIIGASFLILFTSLGISLGFGSVLVSHIAFSIPIVVLLVLPKVNEMDPALINAAMDLGATRWQSFSKVVLPFIAPGIFSGFFMAFTYSLDDFAVTFFVTGNGFATLSVEIYSRARQGISLEINALSAVMFVFALVLVVGYYFIEQYSQSRRKKNKSGKVKSGTEVMIP